MKKWMLVDKTPVEVEILAQTKESAIVVVNGENTLVSNLQLKDNPEDCSFLTKDGNTSFKYITNFEYGIKTVTKIGKYEVDSLISFSEEKQIRENPEKIYEIIAKRIVGVQEDWKTHEMLFYKSSSRGSGYMDFWFALQNVSKTIDCTGDGEIARNAFLTLAKLQ